MASLSGIVYVIGVIGEWFWGIFDNFVDLIVNNQLLLWPVVFALVSAVVFLAIRVVRKFGLRGRG